MIDELPDDLQRLCRSPAWRANELGRPVPSSAHAVSVALPLWRNVIDYEEAKPEALARLLRGYPRHVIHPYVRELAREAGKAGVSLPLPSLRTARMCAAFIRRTTAAPAEIVGRGDVHLVVTTPAGRESLLAFWQHTGLIVSSRHAQALLAGRRAASEHPEQRDLLRQQLADWYGCTKDDVFLAPTGMAAHLEALRAVQSRAPGLPTAQLGFPNIDTLRLQEKLGSGCVLLHQLEGIEEGLVKLLREQAVAACCCEVPGNPLLGTADLPRLKPVLEARQIPLITDDVIGTPFNVDLSAYADLVATSLTKFIAGSGDVMGGALICNPHSKFYHELRPVIQARHEELLWGEDAAVLASRIRHFGERMKRHNQNGLEIAERLRTHPAVERVWYPKWDSSEAYEAVRRTRGGWGSVLSFLPRNAAHAAPGIYDRLAVCKGPSLGTVFTLACPFTLLACYHELNWAETRGVPRQLIRVSVGLEDVEDLWHRIEQALSGEAVRHGGAEAWPCEPWLFSPQPPSQEDLEECILREGFCPPRRSKLKVK